MTALVLDPSAIVEMLLVTEKGARVRAHVAAAEADIHLPEICPVEVLSALRGLVLARKLSAPRAATAAIDIAALKATRHSAQPMLARIWQLRDNVTAYDATYVTLAERLDAPLVTADGKLDTPTARRLITVEVIR